MKRPWVYMSSPSRFPLPPPSPPAPSRSSLSTRSERLSHAFLKVTKLDTQFCHHILSSLPPIRLSQELPLCTAWHCFLGTNNGIKNGPPTKLGLLGLLSEIFGKRASVREKPKVSPRQKEGKEVSAMWEGVSAYVQFFLEPCPLSGSAVRLSDTPQGSFSLFYLFEFVQM